MKPKRIPAKVRAEAIECLLTCAACGLTTWQVLEWNCPAERLAHNALVFVEHAHGGESISLYIAAPSAYLAELRAAAASLLHEGYEP